MLFAEPAALLLPSPLHLLLLLLVLTARAFVSGHGTALRRWRALLLLATAWCWLTATPAFAHWLGRQLEAQYAPLAANEALPPDPVIVVLAAGAPFERSLEDKLQLNLASYRRTMAAAEVWHRTGGTLLFAGTIRPGADRPVARRMANLAEKLGIPGQNIRVETRSLNTFENVRNVMPLIGTHSADSDRRSRIILVTSALHMPRAMAVAHQLGLDPIAAPADYRSKPSLGWRAWLPNSESSELMRHVLHEWAGLMYYDLRGWT